MARVESPEYGADGQLAGCHICPLDIGSNDVMCRQWWYRNGETDALICPTAETYQEAVSMAEKEAHK